MREFLRICYFICVVSLLVSCSTTKFVQDKEYLLDKVNIEPDIKNYKSSDLKSYLRQQPNFKVFGLTKWQLFVYGWSGKNGNKWINKQIRRLGEPPVIMDTTYVEQSALELKRFYINKGFVNADVTASIDTSRHKKATVTYRIKANDPYRIRNYTMALSDTKIDSIAHLTASRRSPLSSAFRSSQDEYNRLIKEVSLFDRDELDQERERITSLLRRHGYYAFNREYLAYIADSSFRQNVVDLDMSLKPYRKVLPNGTVENHEHRQYYINNVTVITDYDPLGLNGEAHFTGTDTIKGAGIDLLYGKNGRTIRPSILRRSTYIRPGQLFNERNIEQTYSAFASLRALKNVNIRFTEIEEQDTMKLDCIILTSPAKIQTVGVDLEGTNSAGDFGFATSLNYQHRNLFKGSEVFSARVRGAYEALSGGGGGSGSYWEMGAEASMLFPRFLFPFLSPDFRRKIRASTEAKISYNLQRRPEYLRAILSGGWSYIWQDRSNMLARHTFKLIDLNYVYLPEDSKDPEFIKSLPEYMVLYNYTNHFIMSTGYTYSFSNYSPQNRLRNTHSLRASFEMAGNLLNGVSSLVRADKNKNGNYELFGTEYAQYVKFDLDFSRGIVLDSRNKLAFHVGLGVGIAYGNSKYLPFERAYFSGGANSVRGWSVRELGPGSMAVTDSTLFALRSGDIRLDLNMEYRTKLFWKFELAAYIDAGNVWTRNAPEEHKDGNFDFSRFYKEIAVSYGLGLRLDFDFFLLRLDTGFKAYDPQMTGSRKWAITHPNFKGNFAWHFAVGYPF